MAGERSKYNPDHSKDITRFAKWCFWIMCVLSTLFLYVCKIFNLQQMDQISYWIVFSPLLTPIALIIIYIVIMLLYMIAYVWIAPKFKRKGKRPN